MRNSLKSRLAPLYATSQRIFVTNLLSGCLVAASVYFLVRSPLPDLVIDSSIKLLLLFRYALAEYRSIRFPPGMLVGAYLLATLISALSCTYIRSVTLMAALNGLLAAALLYAGWHGLMPFILVLGISLVILLITAAAVTDNLLQGRALNRGYRRAAERQQGESAILRHITHSVTPTLQTALSPLNAVVARLRYDEGLDRVISRRRDGSDERMSDALGVAIVGMEQIRDILATTEDIFSNALDEKQFEQLDLRAVFANEILPLCSASRLEIRTDFGSVSTLRLHRASFIQAVKNLIRNAEVHGFPPSFTPAEPPCLFFRFGGTVREVVIDCGNNGLPLPERFSESDYLAFGRKGKESPGRGLGGAWVAKFVELHSGTFAITGRNPVQFRITIPRTR